jgi:hypothetical protein
MASLPVLVVSCDRYADLWRPFFELFWRRWPDCPGPVYLGTNFTTCDDPRVRTIRVGQDVTWASSVSRMLDEIRADYVIVMLEDFLLTETVDNAHIERLADIAVSQQLGSLRLYSIYPPEHAIAPYPELGAFHPGDAWRITAQAAIWRVETLRRLLVPGFSAWDFELIGSQMSDFMPDRIWGVRKPALVYDHAVEKGRWRPQGIAICRAAGVDVDSSKRGAFTAAELQRHEQVAVESETVALRKTDAIRRFREGRRAAGLRDVLWCLRQTPASLQVWAIAAAGCLGPRSMAWLQRLDVRVKVARATRQYHRARRAVQAQPAAVGVARETGRQG